MGRYPLRTWIGRYMDANAQYLAETTLDTRTRVFRGIDRDYALVLAREREKATLRGVQCDMSPNPEKWSEREVVALLSFWATEGVAHSTQRQRISALGKLLDFVGNPVLNQLKAKQPHIFPTGRSERKDALSTEEVSRILNASKRRGGFTGAEAEFFFAMCAYTGVRQRELILSEIGDIDMERWEFTVRHPKGEHRYGRKRILPIPKPIRSIVADYLHQREVMLLQSGMIQAAPLIPSTRRPGKPVSSSTVSYWVRHTMALVDADDGMSDALPFSTHALRRSYGQMLLDKGVSVETVSLMLGHDSTKTTEAWYCRKDDSIARREVNQTFADSEESVSGIPRPMERKRPELTPEPVPSLEYQT
ncbi:MAG: site-specific integrase [Methanobacteriota archaeon]|nr:MAG: site-specific integrase [Euryarchaeota archaeon]